MSCSVSLTVSAVSAFSPENKKQNDGLCTCSKIFKSI